MIKLKSILNEAGFTDKLKGLFKGKSTPEQTHAGDIQNVTNILKFIYDRGDMKHVGGVFKPKVWFRPGNLTGEADQSDEIIGDLNIGDCGLNYNLGTKEYELHFGPRIKDSFQTEILTALKNSYRIKDIKPQHSNFYSIYTFKI